jgi:hypothetical protein
VTYSWIRNHSKTWWSKTTVTYMIVVVRSSMSSLEHLACWSYWWPFVWLHSASRWVGGQALYLCIISGSLQGLSPRVWVTWLLTRTMSSQFFLRVRPRTGIVLVPLPSIAESSGSPHLRGRGPYKMWLVVGPNAVMFLIRLISIRTCYGISWFSEPLLYPPALTPLCCSYI